MKKREKTTYSIIKQELKWIWYQIVVSFIPLIVAIVFNLIVGYNIDLYEIMADYLLAVFAIGMNLKGQELGKRKGISEVFLDIYQVISKIVAVLSALFYIGLFNKVYISDDITKILKERKEVMSVIIVIFICLIAIDGVLAVINDCIYSGLQRESREKKNDE